MRKTSLFKQCIFCRSWKYQQPDLNLNITKTQCNLKQYVRKAPRNKMLEKFNQDSQNYDTLKTNKNIINFAWNIATLSHFTSSFDNRSTWHNLTIFDVPVVDGRRSEERGSRMRHAGIIIKFMHGCTSVWRVSRGESATRRGSYLPLRLHADREL